jgi:large subunit ribosomal protein L24
MQNNKIQTKRFQPKFHVKNGDTVMVIAGSNKGKSGVIKEIITDKYTAVISDVNMVKKHVKPTNNSQGGIVEIEAPINLSNLMVIDPKSKVPTRVRRSKIDGKNVRVSVKTGEIIK